MPACHMRYSTSGLILVIALALLITSYLVGEDPEPMAFLRKVFSRTKSPKQHVSASANGEVPKTMSDKDIDEVAQQTSALALDNDNLTPDAVPYEMATFALS